MARKQRYRENIAQQTGKNLISDSENKVSAISRFGKYYSTDPLRLLFLKRALIPQNLENMPHSSLSIQSH